MDQKKNYEKPQIIESVKLEAIAGACSVAGGKASSGDPACTTVIAS